MKKLAGLAAAGAMLFGMAAPVLGYVYVENVGFAWQETTAMAGATTGENSYIAGENGGDISQSGGISTGNASAGAVTEAIANWYDTTVWSDGDVDVYNWGEADEQETGALAGADTGGNSYLAGGNEGSIDQSGGTTTGDALAVADAQSWANIYTTFVGAW